jgi:hypothetical protein
VLAGLLDDEPREREQLPRPLVVVDGRRGVPARSAVEAGDPLQ